MLLDFSSVHSYLRNNLITHPIENDVLVKRIMAYFITVYTADQKLSMDQYTHCLMLVRSLTLIRVDREMPIVKTHPVLAKMWH